MVGGYGLRQSIREYLDEHGGGSYSPAQLSQHIVDCTHIGNYYTVSDIEPYVIEWCCQREHSKKPDFVEVLGASK